MEIGAWASALYNQILVRNKIGNNFYRLVICMNDTILAPTVEHS